jgi:hypothetical protein
MKTTNSLNLDELSKNQQIREELKAKALPTISSGSGAHKIAKERLLYQLIQEQESIAKALISKAKTGDVAAIREFFDRIYGKAKETIDFGGEVKFSLKSLAQEREKLQAKLVENIDEINASIEIDPLTVKDITYHG